MCKEKKTAVFLAALCFASYAVSYIGRMNYSAALPGMLAEGALSKKQGGVIAAAYFASYGAGQLLNGFLADRGNPKIQVSAGLAGSALFNLLMYFTDSASLMPVIWGLNGYAQSLIWAPAFLMVSRYTGSRYRAEALLLLNTAPSVGTMLAYGFFLGFSFLMSYSSSPPGKLEGTVPLRRSGAGSDSGRLAAGVRRRVPGSGCPLGSGGGRRVRKREGPEAGGV
jgi:sugar phosphate permease